jgi:Ca2+:H+ antiporter
LANPLRRAETLRRAGTWVGGESAVQDSGLSALGRVTSEPTPSVRYFETFEFATKKQDVEEAAVENQPTGRPPSEEQKARQRFISRFRKKHKSEADKEKATADLAAEELPKAKTFTVANQLRATIFNSWLNVLLLAVPAGFVVNYLHLNPIAVFFVNFAAILPLTTLFSYAIDEVRLRYKGVGGMLVYMSFG